MTNVACIHVPVKFKDITNERQLQTVDVQRILFKFLDNLKLEKGKNIYLRTQHTSVSF